MIERGKEERKRNTDKEREIERECVCVCKRESRDMSATEYIKARQRLNFRPRSNSDLLPQFRFAHTIQFVRVRF